MKTRFWPPWSVRFPYWGNFGMPDHWFRVEQHSEQETRSLLGFVGVLVRCQWPDLALLKFADGRREVFRTEHLLALDGPEEPWRSPRAKPTGTTGPQPQRTHLLSEKRVTGRAHTPKTECQRGHPFDEANTGWEQGKHGAHRICRACKNLRRRVVRVKA